MGKTITANMSAHLSGDTTTLVSCWRVERTDGVILGFTDHVENLIVSAVTYEAATGYTPTFLESNARLAVDNMEVIGLLDSAGIKGADIEAKKYDNADVYLFMVNYNDLTMGQIKLSRGRIGNISIRDETYIVELRSLTQLLQQTVGERYSDRCRADLGDSRCKLPIDVSAWASSTVYASGTHVEPATWGGYIFKCTTPGTSGGSEPAFGSTVGASVTDGASAVWETITSWKRRNIAVTSATDRKTFYASALLAVRSSTGYFDYGLVTWVTSSAGNSSYEMEIKSYSSGTVILVEAMPYNLSIGDIFDIVPGCDKRLGTCISTFANVVNMRAEPYLPGLDKISKYGGQ